MKRALVALFAFTCVALAQAQMASSSAATPQAAAPVKDPVTAGLRVLLTRSRNNTLGSISAMPADKFSYKPTPDQMSFAHLVVHIVGFNNALCAKAADIAEPKVEESKESDSKDKLLAAATASFDFCTSALANVDDSKLGENVDFGRVQGPRAMGVFFLAGGWSDHYGAAAMYLRLNGIVPPTAQAKPSH